MYFYTTTYKNTLGFWQKVLSADLAQYAATPLHSLGLFSAFKNRITPRTSQSAGFDIGAFIVTTRYTHMKKFVAPTEPGNYLHSTEHTK